MGKILTAGFFAVVAKANVSLEDLGLTSENCSIVYQTEGAYKAWKPGADLQQFDTLEIGKGYIFIMKDTFDLSTELVDATSDLGGGVDLTQKGICVENASITQSLLYTIQADGVNLFDPQTLAALVDVNYSPLSYTYFWPTNDKSAKQLIIYGSDTVESQNSNQIKYLLYQGHAPVNNVISAEFYSDQPLVINLTNGSFLVFTCTQ